MHVSFKSILIGATLLLSSLGIAQETAPAVGKPWTGESGITETVATIMKRAATTPQRISPFFKYSEKQGPDRRNLYQNPESMPVSQWPLPDTLNGLSAAPDGRNLSFSVGSSFEATNFTEAYAWPPDTMGDVGPSQILVCVNGRIKLFNKNGVVGALNAETDVFFNSVKRANAMTADPRVRFDRQSGRWFIIMMDVLGNNDSNNRILVAVSSGATITNSSSFTFFQFAQNEPTPGTVAFADYPTLGIDKHALYIGTNDFATNGSFNTSLYVIRKSSILSTGPMVVTGFRNLINTTTGIGLITPQGVDNDDPNATEGYVVGVDAYAWGLLVLRKISNPGGTPTLGSNLTITVPTTSFPTSVKPIGTSANRSVDALDDRLLVAKMQANRLTGTRTLWTAHSLTVNASGTAVNAGDSNGRTATRFYEIENLSGTPALKQAGTLFDASTNKTAYWMGAMAMNGQGIGVLGVSSGGIAQRTGIHVAYRLPSDSLGTIRAPSSVEISTADYNDTSGLQTMRWGDYSHTTIDPEDGMTAWTFQMIAKTNNVYKTVVTKLIAPPPAAISTVSPSSGDLGSAVVVTVNGTSSSGSGFFDGGSTFSKRLGVTVSGSGVTVSNIQFVNPTQVKFTATIASGAATGARSITITNPDGQTVTKSSAFTINAAAASISRVDLPAAVASGSTTSVGTVTLTGAAPSGGARVNLSSNDPALTVPSFVDVAAGTSSAEFSLTAAVVGSPTTVQVTGSLGGDASASTVVRAPELTAVYVNPLSFTGGVNINYRVEIGRAAPAGGVTIPLTTADSTIIPLPSTITVPAGATFKVVSVTTTAVQNNVTVPLTASWQGVDIVKNAQVKAPTLTSLVLNPDSLIGGTAVQATGTITIGSPAPVGGYELVLSSTNTLTITIPETVTVPAGATQVTFDIEHKRTTIDRNIKLIAKRGNLAVSAFLNVTATGVYNIELYPATLVGGASSSSTGRVRLKNAAPAGGAVVALSTSDPSIVSLPATVTVPAGLRRADFTITAPGSVAVPTQVQIIASYGGAWFVPMTILPPQLRSLVLTPTSVQGGSATVVKLRVQLNAKAAAGGRTVTLTSSNPGAAEPPTVAVIPEGKAYVDVVVRHWAVGSSTPVTITGTLDGVEQSTVLTVTP